MMDLEWKKFSEKIPDCRLFWVSDFESVGLEIFSPLGIYQDYIEKGYVWAKADIVFPPVPKKERHLCKFIQDGSHWRCVEDPYDELFLEVMIPNEKTPHQSAVIFIEKCPFCGWSKEKK